MGSIRERGRSADVELVRSLMAAKFHDRRPVRLWQEAETVFGPGGGGRVSRAGVFRFVKGEPADRKTRSAMEELLGLPFTEMEASGAPGRSDTPVTDVPVPASPTAPPPPRPFRDAETLELAGRLLDPTVAPGDPRDAEMVIRQIYRSHFPQQAYFSDWHSHPHLLLIGEFAFQIICRYGTKTRDAAQLLHMSGWAARELGYYPQAERHLAEAALLAHEQGWDLIESHARTELANLHFFRRDLPASMFEYELAVVLREDASQREPEWLAQAYCNLGTVQMELGKLRPAFYNVKLAMDEWSTDPEANRGEYPWGLLTQAAILLKSGSALEAKDTSSRAMSMKRQELGADHPLMSYFYSIYARTLLKNRSLSEASRHSSLACELWRSAYGSEHPLLASFEFVRAKVMAAADDARSALTYLEHAEWLEGRYASGESPRLVEIRRLKASLLSEPLRAADPVKAKPARSPRRKPTSHPV